MQNKQYTFSLPTQAGRIIDRLPKMEKSKHIVQALMQYEKEQARQKTLNLITLLKPKDWETDKDAVTLVQEARQQKAQRLSDSV